MFSPRRPWSNVISVLRYLGTVIEQAKERVTLSSLAVVEDTRPVGGGVRAQALALQEAVLYNGRAALSSTVSFCPRCARPMASRQGSCWGVSSEWAVWFLWPWVGAAALQSCPSQVEEGGGSGGNCSSASLTLPSQRLPLKGTETDTQPS